MKHPLGALRYDGHPDVILYTAARLLYKTHTVFGVLPGSSFNFIDPVIEDFFASAGIKSPIDFCSNPYRVVVAMLMAGPIIDNFQEIEPGPEYTFLLSIGTRVLTFKTVWEDPMAPYHFLVYGDQKLAWEYLHRCAEGLTKMLNGNEIQMEPLRQTMQNIAARHLEHNASNRSVSDRCMAS
jgi:hypothetical protein